MDDGVCLFVTNVEDNTVVRSNSKEMSSLSQLNNRANTLLRRRAEDVDYWRKRAGWFDDDASMKEYNNGIYDAYYQPGDDDNYGKRGGRGGGIMSNVTRGSQSEAVKNAIKVLAVLVSVALMVMLCRVISRRIASDSKEKKKSKKVSETQRSPSRSRSRSRPRKTEGYDLMNDDEDGRSRKSTRSSRSKSKRKKSRSRSRQRSRSRSRTEQRSSAEAAASSTTEKKEAVLV